jgi:predicted RNA-binding protein with PIN domain
MADIQGRDGTFQSPETDGDMSVLTGTAPVSTMRDCISEVNAYTKGRGRLTFILKGYDICHNQQEVINEIAYDAESDVENTGDSVFCSHGAGYIVKWNEVSAHQHLAGYRQDEPGDDPPEEQKTVVRRSVIYSGSIEEDRMLQKIFERTYGPVKDRAFLANANRRVEDTDTMLYEMDSRESYLLVDGYNIIFAWDELKAFARDNLDLARQTLIQLLSNYQGYRKNNIILVFDAYKVTGGEERIERVDGIYVVYTREAEIADVYIEKVVSQIGKNYNVRVATSDGMEQLIVLGRGAYRVPAPAFVEELTRTQNEITEFICRYNQKGN